jgi:hypothetical protein
LLLGVFAEPIRNQLVVRGITNPDLLDQMRALAELSDSDGSIDFAAWVLRLLLFAIPLAPLLVRILGAPTAAGSAVTARVNGSGDSGRA